MTTSKSIVFLVDVDDTLLENDRIQDDLKHHIEREFGPECRDRFWVIQEELFDQLGYRDYLGALQRFRVEHPYERHLVTAANYRWTTRSPIACIPAPSTCWRDCAPGGGQ